MRSEKIKHVFFDLDHTLWDFKTNSRETLDEIYIRFNLKEKGISNVLDFIHAYEKVNHEMWALYRQHKITKAELREERFNRAFYELGILSRRLAHEISEYYIFNSPRKTNLFDHTHLILEYLKSKYELHIITNGFEEVQQVKLNRSKLDDYFVQVVTSEMIGKRKPNPEIFHHALYLAGANANESVMIGDDLEADVIGAMNVGIQGIFFNPHEDKRSLATELQFKEIYCLSQLKELL